MEERSRGPGAQPESVNPRILPFFDPSILQSIHPLLNSSVKRKRFVNNGNDSNHNNCSRLDFQFWKDRPSYCSLNGQVGI